MKSINKIYFLTACLLSLGIWGCSSDNDDNGGGSNPPSVNAPGEIDKVVIYEAYPGMFGTSNTLSAISARLDDIEALGMNVLWLMPIFEQGNTPESIGSPYSIKDFTAVNPAYGTLEDVKALVTAAHARGMKVIFDWIANHTSWDNAWITKHPDWYTKDENGEITTPPGQDWEDVADLDFDNTEMRAEMIACMKYWITAADIDGYRCDYADGVPSDFWTDAIAELKALKGDDLFMLAESSDASLQNSGFDMLYGWDFLYRLQEVYKDSKSVSLLYASNTSELQTLTEGKQRMRHILNHDVNSLESVTDLYHSLDGAMSAYVIAATMGGCPMIYSSQEIGAEGIRSFYRNYNTDWSENPDYRREYEKIMAVRGESTALQASGNITYYYVNDAVACYKRYDGNESILVAVNTSGTEKTITVPAQFALTEVRDLMTGSTVATSTTLELDGFGYIIFKLEE
ncbi:MAG: alpha-glucosidase C-terminal domain-containing protein [Alistipes sp.]|nr:alpha-glucosidase C-terminal domain-containing protein [Alistipes sp.]